MLSLDNLTIMGARQDLSDLFVIVRPALAEDAAAAWDRARQSPSPVDALVNGMAAAYGAFTAASEADKRRMAEPLGRAAHLVVVNAWHGKTDEALQIYNACRALLDTAEG